MQKVFLPAPEGTYQIGFATFELTNASFWDRSKKDKNRTFEVCVWYPGENSGNSRQAAYLGQRSPENCSMLTSLVGENIAHNFLLNKPTNALERARISERKDTFPVIIFSRDLGYLPEYYTALMEHLASKGLFVFSINHPFSAEEENVHVSTTTSFSLADFKSREKIISALTRISQLAWGNSEHGRDYQSILGPIFSEVLNEWHVDARFLLDYISSLNKQPSKWNGQDYDFFSSRLDLSQVITLGHGFGSLSLQQLLQDSRISALIHLAGDSSLQLDKKTLTKSTLVISTNRSSSGRESPYFRDRYTEHVLRGCNHNSFTDFVFYEHLKNAFELGELLYSQQLVFNQIKKIVDPFIDRYAIKKISTYRNKQIL